MAAWHCLERNLTCSDRHSRRVSLTGRLALPRTDLVRTPLRHFSLESTEISTPSKSNFHCTSHPTSTVLSLAHPLAISTTPGGGYATRDATSISQVSQCALSSRGANELVDLFHILSLKDERGFRGRARLLWRVAHDEVHGLTRTAVHRSVVGRHRERGRRAGK